MEHFVKHNCSSKENTSNLVLDNRDSLISIPIIQLEKDSGVTMGTFHPHTKHKMQPLHGGIFGPFSTCYKSKMKDWILKTRNAGKPATIYCVAVIIVGQAFPLDFSPKNITHSSQFSS